MGKQSKRRSRPRHRGTLARANADLDTHIASLGLKTVGEYQRWCRQHGFTGALTKDWRERRRERTAATRDAASVDTNASLHKHITELGLPDSEAYQQWCREQDLSDALHKGDRQRRKEIDLAREVASRGALRRVRQLTRRPQETIVALFDGHIDTTDLKPAWLSHVAQLLELDDDQATRDAFRRLLLHTDRVRADLFGLDPAFARFGDTPENRWMSGLLRIARLHEHWQRPVEDWRPQGHNARRHFAALLRHLLARYDVPDFVDTLFLQPADELSSAATGWFLHMATGGNLRTAPNLPISLTKRMAHESLQAPGHFTMIEALRYGQIIGQDGELPLVDAVILTRLGVDLTYEDFWSTVLHWLTRHPMIDLDLIPPIIDYIQLQKYTPQEPTEEDVEGVINDPPEPNFSMKSRSVNKLLDNVEAWQTRLSRDKRVPSKSWVRSAIGEFQQTTTHKKGFRLTWQVRELTTTAELVAEGRAMSHCVRSYATGCRAGRHAVFSVQLTVDDDRPIRLMTIAVSPKTRVISQMRGRFNAQPTGKFDHNARRKSLTAGYRLDLRASRGVVRQWMEAEGIRRGAST